MRVRIIRTVCLYSDLSELLDKETIRLCSLELNYGVLKVRFERTFAILNKLFEDNVFRRYTGEKYKGAVLVSAFQDTATGVFHNIEAILNKPDAETWLMDKVKGLYNTEEYEKNTVPGARAIPRFKELSLHGVKYYMP